MTTLLIIIGACTVSAGLMKIIERLDEPRRTA